MAKKTAPKPAPKSAAKAAPKSAKPEAPAAKPIKQAMTKSALINLIAEENEIPRKTAVGVYRTLENAFLGSVHPRGLGEFTLPGLLKITVQQVPAKKKRMGKDPFTGVERMFAAKPASVKIKTRALKKLKDAAL